MKKTIYCTIDTETVGGASNPTGTYNFGATFHDRDGNVLANTSLLVMQHYDKIRNDDYAKKNFPIYEERLGRGDLTSVATEEDAFNLVRNLCRMYGVKYIMAYNTGFDLCRTICREFLPEFEFIDLYLMALQTVCHQKKYAKFCRKHGLKSKSGKSCATSAESVYAFITNNPDYVEEHTALADALIEKDIFVHCLKMHKKFSKNVHCYDAKGKEYRKCFPKWAE